MLNISIWSRKECAVSDEEQKEKTEERRWRDGSSSPPRLEDGATQTTPTSEAEQDDQPTIPGNLMKYTPEHKLLLQGYSAEAIRFLKSPLDYTFLCL